MTVEIVDIKALRESGPDFAEILAELTRLHEAGELVTLAVSAKVASGGLYYSDFAFPAGEWDGAMASVCILHQRILNTCSEH